MRIFKTRRFAKWAKKEKLKDTALCQAISEIEQGLVDAQLGEYLYKKRMAVRGRGKRSGLRTILAFKVDEKAFFMFGFAKNKLENIDQEQLTQLKILADLFLNYDDNELQRAMNENEMIEVQCYE